MRFTLALSLLMLTSSVSAQDFTWTFGINNLSDKSLQIAVDDNRSIGPERYCAATISHPSFNVPPFGNDATFNFTSSLYTQESGQCWGNNVVVTINYMKTIDGTQVIDEQCSYLIRTGNKGQEGNNLFRCSIENDNNPALCPTTTYVGGDSFYDCSPYPQNVLIANKPS